MGLTFDPSISLTGAVSALGILAGGFMFLITVAGKINRFDARIESIETNMQKQTDILISIARFEEQMTAMREDIARLTASQHDLQVRSQIRGQSR